ncbi:uncharacterized protein [Antedon mediterranea]|uniref:uncharacterized protein isoform X2 n=1 Tax=Antedon mediterranea TaxID=105859 RepID=UPI003AF9E4E6
MFRKTEQLERDLQQAFKEGKEAGLGAVEIQRCVQSVFGRRRPRRKSTSAILKWCLLASIIMLGLVMLLCLYCGPVKMYLKRHMQYFAYLINRCIRFMSLPLLKQLGPGFYKSDCLIRNPWFVQGDDIFIDCRGCSDVIAIKSFQRLHDFTERFFYGGTPIIVKDTDVSNVTFDDIKTRFHKVFGRKEKHAGDVLSKDDRWNTINEVFATEVSSKELSGCNIQWHIDELRGHNFIRNITPVPYFFPIEESNSIVRVLLIDSSEHVYKLPTLPFDNVWLSQVQGSRKIILHPKDACARQCKVVQTKIDRRETY